MTIPRSAIGYAVAFASVAFTLWLKDLVPVIGEAHPFVLLALPIVVAAWYGGLGPGIVATLLAAFGTDLFFITADFGVNGYPIGIVALAIEGLAISWITAGLRETSVRASEAAIVAEQAERSAALALKMREELMSLWVAKLRGPIGDFSTTVEAARIAHRSGDQHQTALALEQLYASASLMRRTVEHWETRDLTGNAG